MLLARRERATSIQETRRRRAIEQLRTGLALPDGAREIWWTIGPRVSAAPLMDLRTLERIALAVSVRSACIGWRAPIATERDMKATADGVYSFTPREDFPRLAGWVDIYGNMAIYADLLQRYKPNFDDPIGREIKLAPRDDEGYPCAINANLIVERGLALLNASRKLYAELGFVGALSLRLLATNALSVPLLFGTEGLPAREHLLSICRLSSEIERSQGLSTEELAGDEEDFMSPIVEEILWAWGCRTVDSTGKVINTAECLHYGSAPCACGLWSRPVNRARCWSCRQEAD